MALKLLGKPASLDILLNIKNKISKFGYSPAFAIIQIGHNPESSLYIKFKQKKADEVGIKSVLYALPKNIQYCELKSLIDQLNQDNNIAGIIVQLPIPKHLSQIVQDISPEKDIDGLTYQQQGLLMAGNDGLFPCTALGVIELLKHYDISLQAKKIAVIGRSSLVGKPLALLLLQQNAMISIFHSKIPCEVLSKELKNFDIVCSAVGKKHFIAEDMIKDGAILVDIGVCRDDVGIHGDFSLNCYPKSAMYTPSVGGVGPMTIACLLNNVLKAYELQK